MEWRGTKTKVVTTTNQAKGIKEGDFTLSRNIWFYLDVTY